MEKMGSSINRKSMARLHKAKVMIAGEQLRLRLHDGKLIKDRRYHLRTYPNCFVAKELTDWLISNKEAPDQAAAVCLMQHLMDHDIVHHVCDKHPIFKDAKLLYRFRKDDGTFPFNTEVKVFIRGQRLYEHLITGRDSILQLREEQGVAYQRSIPGCQLMDWLLQNGETESRRQGLEFCRALLEHGIIQHVSKKYDFFDSRLLYQFCINFRRRRHLSELLNETDRDKKEGASVHALEDNHADSPFVLPKIPPQEESSGFQSVLKRNVTCEELLSPGAPFIKRVLTVMGDAVGWGFVIRGVAPVYVQAVDPGSPAAAAGVKVRQFVCQVNGRSVLHLDYRQVTRLVMTGPHTVVLEVMEPLG
ncbi:DEP domain-containing mTOR-interacting protein isoform X2 [Oncorhynchus kisutch]|uniref:DEP domain-containing mTOR-interacting protein isoform X2 n=1 Tax=Oncorhynchus kisutch TaxID=8019 RepID=UPI0009A07022|nr:DEP domain-containing mTOR-interacting protein isoform X2 [Oncorhynchus kisutch]